MTRRRLRPVIAVAAIGIAAGLLAFGARNASIRSQGLGASLEPLPDYSVPEPAAPPAPGTVTVDPERIDEVLVNPGMGFASFHFGWWCNLPPITYPPQKCAERVLANWPKNYPESGTAYFRWHWSEIEPERGRIDFEMIDNAIQSANALGMTLGFRVMTVAEGKSGLPDWLTSAPYEVAGQWRAGGAGKTFWPDYRDGTLQREHARLIGALGNRYNGHPAVDHVDIGTVGCWGEWNTACLSDVDSIIDVYEPGSRKERKEIAEALTQLIDHHLRAFSETPVIMLALDEKNVPLMLHATRGGAGWRADCWGDWGLWGGSWSHQKSMYPPMLAAARAADPGFVDVWKRAPIQLEVCGTLSKWHELGWGASVPDGELHKSFQWALRQHSSVLNAKSQPVPASYVAPIDGLLKKNGFRFVIDHFNHPKSVRAGGSITVIANWSNLGVAPAYLQRVLAYRLRGASQVHVFRSAQDTRTWLPGRWEVRDTFAVPADLPGGAYQVEVALLDRAGRAPATEALPPLRLGIAGRRADGWYPVSELTVE
ncbi:MAG: DUF4832 domain-containing protein [Deltaproteobacteria bacterium]|nr:DUF4832 domain-containing protein [Deltaproteobacteria bacterium]MBT8465509.1 DUF4832 domain-containing protein [Deltaproteobacteria bacterium]NND28017.1 DUF4832 domain-containing protein [Myxococcales bacterium]NNK08224.1 DUF4832 domain-containing protein [Myxococcales bacterium]NNK44750.1 DUF4832 domain-containing protein [Myxococcales bacterium]